MRMGWEVSTLIIKNTVKELIYDYTNINLLSTLRSASVLYLIHKTYRVEISFDPADLIEVKLLL